MRDEYLPRHLLPHARVALTSYLNVKPGERLVLAGDETASYSLFEAFRIAAELEGVPAVDVIFRPLAEREIREYGLFAGRSLMEPLHIPDPLLSALSSCDAFVLLGSDTELLFSPDLKSVLAGGGRGLLLPYHNAHYAYRLLFRDAAAAREQADVIDAVGRIVDAGSDVHVWSEEGTDLRMQLGEYRTLWRGGAVKAGELQILPAGNIARVPDAESLGGTLVIDRTICANDYKELVEPIVLEVAAGKVTQVTGGLQAKLLRTFLESLNDERAYHLTELGIGTNPLCRWSGIGAPSEDTHQAGTVAFALGCDTHVGGVTPAPVHIDMTMRFPSLSVDGQQIIGEGRLLV